MNALGANNVGIYLYDGGYVNSSGTGIQAGNITMKGTGGNGTSYNYGLIVHGIGSKVQSIDGDITIDGKGGNGSGEKNQGIVLYNNGIVISTGAGAGASNITMRGTGGTGLAL